VSYAQLPVDIRDLAEQHLTRKQLDVLKLRTNGYSYVRISLLFGISEATVRGHHRRALQILAQHIDPERIAA